MKFYLRNSDTREFYTGDSQWSQDRDQALPFASPAAALAEVSTPFPAIELLLCSEIVNSQIPIPLKSLVQGAPVQALPAAPPLPHQFMPRL